MAGASSSERTTARLLPGLEQEVRPALDAGVATSVAAERSVSAHVALRLRNGREIEDPELGIVVRDEARLAVPPHVEGHRVQLTPHRESLLVEPLVLERRGLAQGG